MPLEPRLERANAGSHLVRFLALRMSFRSPQYFPGELHRPGWNVGQLRGLGPPAEGIIAGHGRRAAPELPARKVGHALDVTAPVKSHKVVASVP